MIKEIKSFTLLQPSPDACQICGTKHEPDEPHSKHCIYYQINYLINKGRLPTWKDAMSHCTDRVKKAWIKELKRLGSKDLEDHE